MWAGKAFPDRMGRVLRLTVAFSPSMNLYREELQAFRRRMGRRRIRLGRP